MGSAAVAPSGGRDMGTELPHSTSSVARASGQPRSVGAAAPTTAPVPRLRRRFLREMCMLLLLGGNCFCALSYSADIGARSTQSRPRRGDDPWHKEVCDGFVLLNR